MFVLAVDDEKIGLELLAGAIMTYDSDLSVSMFRNPVAALEFSKSIRFDVAFLDIDMPEMTGMELAERLKEINPDINIIFTTAFTEYALDAFKLHASGYLTKPVTAEDIAREMEYLRIRVSEEEREGVPALTAKPPVKDIVIRCFGHFEIFKNGQVINFSYSRSKELLAYLVDRRGAACSAKDVMAVFWGDDKHSSYLRNIRKDLMDTLARAGCEGLVVNNHGKLNLTIDMVTCDYYNWLNGIERGKYHGEYMSQYEWAEATNGWLMKNK